MSENKNLVIENSLFLNPQERAAFLADKQKVIDAFWVNTLGFLALKKANTKKAVLYKYLTQVDKTRVDNIPDNAHDMAVSIRLAKEAKVLPMSFVNELTKLLQLLKTKRDLDVDEALVRALYKKLNFSMIKPSVKIIKPIQEWLEGKQNLIDLVYPFFVFSRQTKQNKDYVSYAKYFDRTLPDREHQDKIAAAAAAVTTGGGAAVPVPVKRGRPSVVAKPPANPNNIAVVRAFSGTPQTTRQSAVSTPAPVAAPKKRGRPPKVQTATPTPAATVPASAPKAATPPVQTPTPPVVAKTVPTPTTPVTPPTPVAAPAPAKQVVATPSSPWQKAKEFFFTDYTESEVYTFLNLIDLAPSWEEAYALFNSLSPDMGKMKETLSVSGWSVFFKQEHIDLLRENGFSRPNTYAPLEFRRSSMEFSYKVQIICFDLITGRINTRHEDPTPEDVKAVSKFLMENKQREILYLNLVPIYIAICSTLPMSVAVAMFGERAIQWYSYLNWNSPSWKNTYEDVKGMNALLDSLGVKEIGILKSILSHTLPSQLDAFMFIDEIQKSYDAGVFKKIGLELKLSHRMLLGEKVTDDLIRSTFIKAMKGDAYDPIQFNQSAKTYSEFVSKYKIEFSEYVIAHDPTRVVARIWHNSLVGKQVEMWVDEEYALKLLEYISNVGSEGMYNNAGYLNSFVGKVFDKSKPNMLQAYKYMMPLVNKDYLKTFFSAALNHNVDISELLKTQSEERIFAWLKERINTHFYSDASYFFSSTALRERNPNMSDAEFELFKGKYCQVSLDEEIEKAVKARSQGYYTSSGLMKPTESIRAYLMLYGRAPKIFESQGVGLHFSAFVGVGKFEPQSVYDDFSERIVNQTNISKVDNQLNSVNIQYPILKETNPDIWKKMKDKLRKQYKEMDIQNVNTYGINDRNGCIKTLMENEIIDDSEAMELIKKSWSVFKDIEHIGPKPKREDFDDWSAYYAADNRWRTLKNEIPRQSGSNHLAKYLLDNDKLDLYEEYVKQGHEIMGRSYYFLEELIEWMHINEYFEKARAAGRRKNKLDKMLEYFGKGSRGNDRTNQLSKAIISNKMVVDGLNDLTKNSPIPILKKVNAEEVDKILKFNNFTPSTESIDRKKKNESFFEFIERHKDKKAVIPPLRVKRLEETQDDMEKRSVEFAKHNAGRHGDISALFLESFDVDLPSKEFDDFIAENPQPTVIPAFHGTGSIAAAMILRFGFKIVTKSVGGVAVTGKMLGNGVYFSNKLDKALQYIGDEGYARTHGMVGYILEMDAYIGKKGKDHNVAGTGNDQIRSPEWCVFNPRAQLRIRRAHKVKLVPGRVIKQLKEKHGDVAEGTYFPSFKNFLQVNEGWSSKGYPVSFHFYDGQVPDENGRPIEHEDFEKKYHNQCIVQSGQQGPMVTVFADEKQKVPIWHIPRTGDMISRNPEGVYTAFRKAMGWE